MTTLEIITRCYRRPVMLEYNQWSLSSQTCADWHQTLLVDGVGIGVGRANAMLADVTPTGRYVWVLDDDDLCIYDDLTADVAHIADEHNPDVIFMRFDHGWIGVLPFNQYWRTRPERGNIGGSGIIVRNDIWMRCRDAWRTGIYSSDYDYVAACYDAAHSIYWHDIVAGRVQRISQGAPE